MKVACESCQFFELNRLYANVENVDGSCRRFAPTVVVVSNETYSVWPKVTINDWCGEYEKKE